jgi:hypothetical protein
MTRTCVVRELAPSRVDNINRGRRRGKPRLYRQFGPLDSTSYPSVTKGNFPSVSKICWNCLLESFICHLQLRIPPENGHFP